MGSFHDRAMIASSQVFYVLTNCLECYRILQNADCCVDTFAIPVMCWNFNCSIFLSSAFYLLILINDLLAGKRKLFFFSDLTGNNLLIPTK